MGYYSKKDIQDYVGKNIKEIQANGLESLNPESEVIKRLNDEEDLIAFFWIDYKEHDLDEKTKMEGKCWYRINHDIYTDDRFAIDLYHAMKAGLTVSDVIKKRDIDKEFARKRIIDINALEETIKKNIKTDGD